MLSACICTAPTGLGMQSCVLACMVMQCKIVHAFKGMQ